VRQELRAELDRWIEATNDQGRVPEQPEVIEYWKADAKDRHGKNLPAPPVKE